MRPGVLNSSENTKWNFPGVAVGYADGDSEGEVDGLNVAVGASVGAGVSRTTFFFFFVELGEESSFVLAFKFGTTGGCGSVE